jgi:DHA2 family multidrug resistance protein-like MFS transporter
MPPHTAAEMLAAARDSFVHGLHLASGAGAVVLLATAAAAWFLLKGQRLEGTLSA